jgi:hypothetical protein
MCSVYQKPLWSSFASTGGILCGGCRAGQGKSLCYKYSVGAVCFYVVCGSGTVHYILVCVPYRRDGPLASMVLDDDKTPIEELIRQAKLMLHCERGCLAIICDDDEIGLVKSLVSAPNPPILHLHHSSMFAFMKSAEDTRFSPYHSVR